MSDRIVRKENGDGTTTFDHGGEGKHDEVVSSQDADRFQEAYEEKGYEVTQGGPKK